MSSASQAACCGGEGRRIEGRATFIQLSKKMTAAAAQVLASDLRGRGLSNGYAMV